MEIALPTWSGDWEGDLVMPEGLTLIDNHLVQPAGFWYYFSTALQEAIEDETIAGVEPEVQGGSSDATGGPAARHTTKAKKFTKLTPEELQIDWYGLFSITNPDTASDSEIRAAYKRACLETHPDKQPGHSDVLFKRVQRGLEILGCPDARRAYDSSLPFDDTIPLEGTTLEDDASFFTIFGPVFERNKKFSSDSRIADLGDMSTPVTDVRKMYTDWLAFHSWRDFSHDASDLEEINENMSRDEKRYYMRENQRVLDKHKKDEQKRVRNLVERAMKIDPRLRIFREEQIAAKEKEKADKEAAIEKVRAEAEAKLVAKYAAEREAAEAIQAEKDRQRKLLVDLKEHIITRFEKADILCEVPTNKLLPDVVRLLNVEWLVSVMHTAEDLQTIADHFDAIDDSEIVAAFNDYIQERELIVGQSRYGEPCRRLDAEGLAAHRAEAAKAREAARIRAASVVWEEEDVANLTKAIAKYPGGTLDRWRKMAQFMRDKYTEDEVLLKTKSLEAALKKSSGGGTATTSAAQRAGNASSVKPSASAPPSASDVEDWTPEQQKSLEAGLRQLKAYKGKDKWPRIAKGVEGKDGKQCFERFRHLTNLNKKE